MTTGKIIVLGSDGQLGQALLATLGEAAMGLDRTQADLAEPDRLAQAVEACAPAAIVNAAAYTKVDQAETEAGLAYTINADSPRALARLCAREGVPFIHYSTDYVLGGSGTRAWRESDAPRPLNVYGASKRAGEEAVMAEGGRYLIFRTSWVYSAAGKNFLTTMLRLAREQAELRIVYDQTGAPTYAAHLAEASVKALALLNAKPELSGLYHLAASGETSWHGFASAIFGCAHAHGEELRVARVLPVASCDYPTAAVRPLNSRLDCTLAETKLGLRLPPWQEGLAACMREYYAHHRLPA